MNINKLKITSLILAAGLMTMIAAAACGGGDPEELSLPVKIEAGEMSPETIKVKQGDMVTLNIEADEGGAFHLHTYDIEAEIDAEAVTDFYFVAEATGRFKITYHPQGEHDDSGHGGVFESEALAPGETFSYEIEDHQAGETIPFHSHLRPALTGTLIVSQEAGQTAAVAINYTDDGAVPTEIHAGPGTVVTWTNNSSVPQTVISGRHADFVMDTDPDMDMNTGADEHDDEHDDEEVEIEIGFVEVQPR